MVLDMGKTPQKPEGMLCPHCQVPLAMTSRQNIEIDYCPKCRGVWLDRGELDKIIEKSLSEVAASAPAPEPQPSRRYDDRRDERRDDRRDGYRDDYRGKKRYKKKSWIAEIFDELT